MRLKSWRPIILKDFRLRVIRENLRTLISLAVDAEISRLNEKEDLYRQRRINHRQTPSQWRRELSIYDKKESIMKTLNSSILRCSEGSTCKSREIMPLTQDILTLDKDMVWNPLLRHWICINCYNFYYKSESAKRRLEEFLKQDDLQ